MTDCMHERMQKFEFVVRWGRWLAPGCVLYTQGAVHAHIFSQHTSASTIPGCHCVSSLALGHDLFVVLNRLLLVLDRLSDRRLQRGHCVGLVLHRLPVVCGGLVKRRLARGQRCLRHVDGFLGVLEVCGVLLERLVGAGTRRRRVSRGSWAISPAPAQALAAEKKGRRRCYALGDELGAVRWLDGLRAFLLDIYKRGIVKVEIGLCLVVLGDRVVVGIERGVVGGVVRGLVLARGGHDRVQVRQSGVHVVVGGLQRLRRGCHLGLGGREELRAVRRLALHQRRGGAQRVSSVRRPRARATKRGARRSWPEGARAKYSPRAAPRLRRQTERMRRAGSSSSRPGVFAGEGRVFAGEGRVFLGLCVWIKGFVLFEPRIHLLRKGRARERTRRTLALQSISCGR